MAFKTCESLDTNILLRLILKDVPGQCRKIVDLFMRYGYVYSVADLAITEAVYVMQTVYKLPREKIISGLLGVLQPLDLKYNRALFDQVFPMYLESPKLSFNDCCLAVYAAQSEAEPLWTFDKALAKGSGTAKLVK